MQLAESLLVLTAVAAVLCDEPMFRIVTKRAGDKVVVYSVGDRSTLTVHSASGIGSAVIERPVNGWSKAADLVLQLRLNGLEELRINAAGTNWLVSVSSSNKKQRIVIKRGKDETEIIDSNSQYWTDVMVREFYELKIPKAIFADDPKSITINWIDFYR